MPSLLRSKRDAEGQFRTDAVTSTLSVSVRNLSSISSIEAFASFDPVSRMSSCRKGVFTTVMPAFSRCCAFGITPGSVLNCGSFERKLEDLELAGGDEGDA